MRITFASGREILEDNDWTVVETSGTLPAGTYYFSLQAKNKIGKNKIHKKQITLAANKGIQITINTSALKSYEFWESFILGYSYSGSDTEYRQIKEFRVYEYGNKNIKLDLPFSYTILEESQLLLNEVATITALSETSVDIAREGIIYKVTSNNSFYKFSKDSYTNTEDNIIIESIYNSLYKWKKVENIYCLVADTKTTGCDQDIRYNNNDLESNEYYYNAEGLFSDEINYLIYPEDSYSDKFIIDFAVFVNSLNLSEYFYNKLVYKIKGIFNKEDYTLKDLSSVGDNVNFIVYQSWSLTKENIEYISGTLNENEAFLISVKLKFYLDEFLINLPEDTNIKIIPYIKTDLSVYNESNLSYGKGVLFYSVNSNYCRVLPDVTNTLKVSSGLGIIQGYSFNSSNEYSINIPTNKDSSVLKINKDGLVFYDDSLPNDLETIRAYVSTAPIESDIKYFFKTKGLTLNIEHPKDTEGYAFIREDYPDVIKGQKAYFNPTGFILYIKDLDTGINKKFTFNSIVESVSLTWSEGETITSIPINPLNGFYQVKRIIGSIEDKNYSIGLAYTYDGSTVSVISHSPSLGCVLELPATFSSSAEVQALLGSASYKNVGTEIGDVIELQDLGDSTPTLPAIDGSQLLGIDKIEAIYKNINFIAEHNKLYLVDTSLSNITAYLPTEPVEGKRITFNDYAGTTYKNPTGFGKHSLIIDGQGYTIEEENTLEVDLENANVTIIFINDGWKLYTDFNTVQTSQAFSIDLTTFQSPLTNKGDLWVFSSSNDRQAKGNDGQVLTSNSSTNTGLSWTTPFSGNYNDLTNKPILGTASSLNVGTSANNVVKLDSLGKLPAIDGSQLTNLPSFSGSFNDLEGTPSFGTAAYLDTGTSPNNVVKLDSLGKLPAIDASQLTNIPPGSYNNLEDLPVLGTASSLDYGIEAGNVVRLQSINGVVKLPAVDGSQLKNLPTGLVSPLSAKGDIWIYNGTINTKLPKGINGQILTTNSLTTTGLEWLDPFSGSYNDLTDKPTLFSGSYNDLTDTPVLFSGSYTDLTNKPSLFSGSYNDLTNKPSLFSGNYNDLTNKPVIFSGNYNDLTNKPTIGNLAFNLVQLDANAKIPTELIDFTTNAGSPLTTKGDIWIHNGGINTRLPVGLINGQVLKVDSSTDTGLKWEAISYSDISGTPTLGTAASLNVGTSSNNIVQLDSNAKLPAIDGSQLTNLPISPISPSLTIVTATDTEVLSSITGKVYMNAVSGSTTVTLPSNPSVGDWCYFLRRNSNAFVIERNGTQTISFGQFNNQTTVDINTPLGGLAFAVWTGTIWVFSGDVGVNIPTQDFTITKTSNYTITQYDHGLWIPCNTNNLTITLPNGLLTGTQVIIDRQGTATVTVTASTTLIGKSVSGNSVQIANQYGIVHCVHTGSNIWRITGDL